MLLKFGNCEPVDVSGNAPAAAGMSFGICSQDAKLRGLLEREEVESSVYLNVADQT